MFVKCSLYKLQTTWSSATTPWLQQMDGSQDHVRRASVSWNPCQLQMCTKIAIYKSLQ